jgi:hypothetical protein
MLGRKRRSAPIFQNSTRGRERYAGRRLLPSLTVVCKIQWHDEKIASNAQTSLCATRSAAAGVQRRICSANRCASCGFQGNRSVFLSEAEAGFEFDRSESRRVLDFGAGGL